MRLFNLLKTAFTKLGLIANFIIEEYDEDIWHVVKYNNGIIKAYINCDGEYSKTGTVMGPLMGGYYSRCYISRPSGFITVTFKGGSGRTGTGGGFLVPYLHSNQVMLDIVGNQNSASMKFTMLLIGTWK